MCSVPEQGGMERRSRDGSDTVFDSEKNEERNGSILCSVGGIGTELTRSVPPNSGTEHTPKEDTEITFWSTGGNPQ
jgi:hypothetical protein